MGFVWIVGCVLRDGFAVPLVRQALKRLEYRGYDSCGVVTISEGGLHVKKDTGRIDEIYGRLNVVTDQYVSPTLSSNLADMILEIVERKLAGLMHTAGASRINRYDMALRIAEVFGLEKELLHPVCSDSIKWKAKRPKDSSLSVEKIRISLKTKPLNLTESLLHMKREETCLSGVKK